MEIGNNPLGVTVKCAVTVSTTELIDLHFINYIVSIIIFDDYTGVVGLYLGLSIRVLWYRIY